MNFNNKIVYQIYPLTFNSQNQKQVGNIQGIIEKLPYFKKLNVDYLWLSSVNDSPMIDNGYDVSDYLKINPLYGSNDDYQRLIDQAKKYQIKLIFDLVMNHTSNQHQWFKKSLAKIEPYTDYYVWRDQPVKKFTSQFANKSWTFHPQREQYYLHQFALEQPDLNWENPQLIKEFRKIIKYWIGKGVAGFRFDVVDMLGKQIDLGIKIDPPRVKKILKALGEDTFIDSKIFTVGECWSLDLPTSYNFTTSEKPILKTLFNARYLFLNEAGSRWKHQPLTKKIFLEYKKWIARQEFILKDNLIPLFLENHDFARSVTRIWNDDLNLIEKAKMLAVIHYLRQGIMFIYQGQELGLPNAKFKNKAQINDLETHKFMTNNPTLNNHQLLKALNYGSRDNPRKPIPWNEKIVNQIIPFYNYGSSFTLESQLKNPNSVWNFYYQILEFKKQNQDFFMQGKLTFLYLNHPSIFGHKITLKNQELIILTNWFDDFKHLVPKDKIVVKQNYQKGILGKFGFLVYWKINN